MVPRRLELFVAAPSERGPDWFVFECHAPSRPLFVGPREAAEFEADRRTLVAQQQYEESALDEFIAHSMAASQQSREQMMRRFEEQARLYEERVLLGVANNICLAALSSPK